MRGSNERPNKLEIGRIPKTSRDIEDQEEEEEEEVINNHNHNPYEGEGQVLEAHIV